MGLVAGFVFWVILLACDCNVWDTLPDVVTISREAMAALATRVLFL